MTLLHLYGVISRTRKTPARLPWLRALLEKPDFLDLLVGRQVQQGMIRSDRQRTRGRGTARDLAVDRDTYPCAGSKRLPVSDTNREVEFPVLVRKQILRFRFGHGEPRGRGRAGPPSPLPPCFLFHFSPSEKNLKFLRRAPRRGARSARAHASAHTYTHIHARAYARGRARTRTR